MKYRELMIFLFIILFNLISYDYLSSEDELVVDRVVPSVNKDDPEEAKFYPGNIMFKNGELLKTNIYELKYIGILSNEKQSVLILSGRECYECDAPFELFMHPLHTGKLDIEKSIRHSHPGRHYLEGNLIYEARTFLGDCLCDKKKELVWFETDHENQNKTYTFFVLRINKTGKLTKEHIEDNLPDINLTLEKVKRGLCIEIQGFEYHSL